jgi:tetratricopeptide (TPR) repeat protein
LYNNSYTFFNNNIDSISTPQIIRDNKSYELYASENSFPSIFRWNQIIDAYNLQDPLLWWDIDTYERIKARNINHNYWGEKFVKQDALYPCSAFICDTIWHPESDKGSIESRAETIYQSGLYHFAAENYSAAETTFKELIEEYPASQFATAAMHELLALKQLTTQDFETLRVYYSTFTEADSTLFDIAQFLSTRCNIIEKNWQPAITWYENRIQNPPTYQDSIFAVIDLGDIYLQMEADSANMELKAKSFIFSRFPNIKPKSRVEFEKNKSALLATLPQKKSVQKEQPLANGNPKGSLQQNIPNPANQTTTIIYELYAEGNIEIQIYNILGQQVQTIPFGIKKAGIFETEISLKTIPAGMYEYALFIDGIRIDAKKMIVNK